MTFLDDKDMFPLISIIMCMRNSEEFLEECLKSIENQTYKGPLELAIFDDGSSDRSSEILQEWENRLRYENKEFVNRLSIVKYRNDDVNCPKGVGWGKNKAIEISSGQYLCFMDSDDIMDKERLEEQLKLTKKHSNVIVGSKIRRIPEDATPRYTNWANSLTPIQLHKQIYTCFGPTIIMPTWFCLRETFKNANASGFDQSQPKGVPEDLIFFYKHLRIGGRICRSDKMLLTYRYHKNATTFSISDETIWKIRLNELENGILRHWNAITIWNAGKEGRRLYRSLSEENRKKVIAMADVDAKKINKKFYTYEESRTLKKPKIPIIHFTKLLPPVIICVKLGLYNGKFEANLDSMNLVEGIDFVHFG